MNRIYSGYDYSKRDNIYSYVDKRIGSEDVPFLSTLIMVGGSRIFLVECNMPVHKCQLYIFIMRNEIKK